MKEIKPTEEDLERAEEISLNMPGNWPDEKSQEIRNNYIAQHLAEERMRTLKSAVVIGLLHFKCDHEKPRDGCVGCRVYKDYRAAIGEE